MATKKKLLEAAAGAAAGGEGLNVESVFSTYLYEGNGSEQFIDNGINLGQANDGYSAYFGGSGYYVTAEQTTLTDFTVEGWFYFSNLGSNRSLFTLGNSDLQAYYRSASSNFAIYDGSAKTYSWTPTGSTWYHIALVRSGSSVELFVDGVSKGTQTSSATISGNLIIGGYNGATDPMNGYISNIRVSDNVRYSSNFTAPTSALTTDANTTLLTLQDSTFIDNSGNGNVITPSGGAEMVSHAPFTAADAGEGGLVWIKNRTGENHGLVDTEVNGLLFSNLTNAANTGITHTFNSNGFTVGSSGAMNDSPDAHASWTFRKAPKFFDVVTWTGDGTGARTISHNLGATPGSIIRKKTSGTERWYVWHRSVSNDLSLNETTAASYIAFNATDPTSTEFTVSASGNISGETHVAYLFAHNDGDGDFGPTGDQDIIKCGSYTGTGSEMFIDLGFEPQWILTRRTDTTDNWFMVDTMRGIVSGGGEDYLWANTSNAEQATTAGWAVNPTGFTVESASRYASGGTYIYIAIRRGPMAVPTAATDVFQVGTVQNNTPKDVSPASDFPVDFVLHHAAANSSTGNKLAINRLANDLLYTNLTGGAYGNYSSYSPFDHMDNVQLTGLGAANGAAWMWKRAPNYFDVVAYTGNGTAGRTVSHNLGVAPEMMWVKSRSNAYTWVVYHKGLNGGTNPEQYYLRLDTTGAEGLASSSFNDTAPTASNFTLGIANSTNGSGNTYIAYLFASVDGVSKVGSYTGTGSDQNIDCGFSSGARFVLIKNVTTAQPWYVLDTERGIVAGNDPFLKLNDTAAETTVVDFIDPYSSGFTIVGSDTSRNATGSTYIFYAIA